MMTHSVHATWQLYRIVLADSITYLRAHQKNWLPLLLCCISITTGLLLLPVWVSYTAETALSGQHTLPGGFLILFNLLCFSVLTGFYHISCGSFSQSVSHLLTDRLYIYFHFQSPLHYNEGAATAFNAYLTDIHTLSSGLQRCLPLMLISVLLLMTSFIAVLMISTALTAITLLSTGIAAVILLCIRRYDRIARHTRKQLLLQETDFMQQNLAAIATIQAQNQQENNILRRAELIKTHDQQRRPLTKINGIMRTLSALASWGAVFSVLWFGHFMTWHDTLSMITQLTHLMYVVYIIFALRQLIQTHHQLFALAQSYFNLKTLFNTPFDILSPLIPDRLPDSDDNGMAIDISKVTYRYPAQQHAALHNISLTVHPGELIGIEGGEGAGKSSLLYLLLRLCPPAEGRILLNETDIQWLALTDLRQHIGYVSQQTMLSEGSVFDNLRFFNPQISEASLLTLTRSLGIDAYFTALPQGYHTQYQRETPMPLLLQHFIGLIRALIHQPSLFIIDEMPHLPDPQSEHYFYEAVLAAAQQRTTLLVTQQRAILKQCDRILHLEHGEITAFDTYAKLYGKK